MVFLTYELQGIIDELIKMIVKETHSHKHKRAKGSNSKSESTELSLASRKASVIPAALHPDMITFFIRMIFSLCLRGSASSWTILCQLSTLI